MYNTHISDMVLKKKCLLFHASTRALNVNLHKTFTFTFEKLRYHFDASSVNYLKCAIQKTMHAFSKSTFQNPKRLILLNVFTLHEAQNVIKAVLFY